MASSDVLIIGAGVSGLTTALVLVDAGVPASTIRLIADTPPVLTTSCCAGAIWGPYLSSYDRRTEEWSRHTLARFRELAAGAVPGVQMVYGVEASRTGTEPPGWAREVQGFTPCTRDELPAGFVSGWRYAVPVIDMPPYLAYLEKRLDEAGIAIQNGHVGSLHELTGTLTGTAGAVVNCAGLGARQLVPDTTVRPVRGQLVVVENPGIDTFFAEHTDDVCDLTYLLPQGDHVVLGGSVEEDESDRVADPGVARDILDRCARIEPALRGLTPVEHRVGIRPARPLVRVERDDSHGVPVLHNYGHGGSGVSLSWGCARDIARMVAAL